MFLWKWIIFIFIAPLLAIRNYWKSNSVFKRFREAVQNISKNKVSNYIRNFINGFARYMSIRLGFIPSHSLRKIIYKNVFGVDLQKKA